MDFYKIRSCIIRDIMVKSYRCENEMVLCYEMY